MGILKICAKCSDLCFTMYWDKNGKVLAQSDSYVPKGINIGGSDDDGDYVDIQIDMETGQILNWKKVSDAKIIKAIKAA